MFPTNFLENTTAAAEETVPGTDFLFDYSTGQHIMDKGAPAEQSVFLGVKQYIENVLRTPANTIGVYTKAETETFGISIYEHIGERKLPDGYLNSELKREVTENLLRHPLITEVRDWKAERTRRRLDVSFAVVLTDSSIINYAQILNVIG